MPPTGADSRLTDSAAPKLLEGAARNFKLRPAGVNDVQDQAAPSRSAVVSMRASFGRSRQSRAPGSGKDDGD